jgi:hypothetical protein
MILVGCTLAVVSACSVLPSRLRLKPRKRSLCHLCDHAVRGADVDHVLVRLLGTRPVFFLELVQLREAEHRLGVHHRVDGTTAELN